jgi:leucyl-tRNA synthetase
MSKSKGNGIDPMSIIESYGADVLRTYILFMGEYSMESPWNDSSIKGISRFLDKVYTLKDKVIDSNKYTQKFGALINKTIKKVGEDIENMKYNTAISELMKLVNEYVKEDNITSLDYEILLKLLYPFAPHITEELNSIVLNKESLVYSSWPSYDDSKIKEESYELVVQVNGKLRSKIEVDINTSEDDMKDIALKQRNVINHIKDKEILKVIVVAGKLVNIVVK